MIFDVAEVKAEFNIDTTSNSLLGRTEQYWKDLLPYPLNKQLTSLTTDKMECFVFEGAVLLVKPSHLKIISKHLSAIDSLLNSLLIEYSKDQIQSFVTYTKSEFSTLETLSELSKIQKKIAGNIIRFGQFDSHHMHILNVKGDAIHTNCYETSELILYHNSIKVLESLSTDNQLEEVLNLNDLLKGFQKSYFSISENFHSFFAIRHSDYVIIRMSPKEDNVIVSIETNLNDSKIVNKIFKTILSVLMPHSFDLLNFNYNLQLETKEDHICVYQSKDNLLSGHQINFKQFLKEDKRIHRGKLIQA